MQRIALTDNTGRWFDAEKALVYQEATRWDGSNHVSLATGSQWDHERLYRTAGGRWILNTWSQWEGTAETYAEISDANAAQWLVENDHETHAACADEYSALEIR